MTKNRIQIDMTQREMWRLESLKTRTEAASWAEVIRIALKRYEAHLNDQLADAREHHHTEEET